MSSFVEIFEKYGYNVESFGESSYIADNGVYCIPFTEYVMYGRSFMCGVSLMHSAKEELKRRYAGTEIGKRAYRDWSDNRLGFDVAGGIGNSDHSLGEVESWLKRS